MTFQHPSIRCVCCVLLDAVSHVPASLAPCVCRASAEPQCALMRSLPGSVLKRRMNAQGDWPKKPVVSSYDVVEKGGFVWLFYGNRGVPEDVRPPIPMMPEVRLVHDVSLDSW